MSSGAIVCDGCGVRNRVRPQAARGPRCRRCHRWLPWLVDASDDDFADVVGSAPIPVVVDFWGAWCAHSRRLDPILEQLARELAGRAKLVRADVEKTPQRVERYEVRSVTTLLMMHRETAIARTSGAARAFELRYWVEEALRSSVGVAASDR